MAPELLLILGQNRVLSFSCLCPQGGPETIGWAGKNGGGQSQGRRVAAGAPGVRRRRPGGGRSASRLHFFVPLNQALARGCPGLRAGLPGGGLLWPKNEQIWGCQGLPAANPKIDLFPWPFYSAHNGIPGQAASVSPRTMAASTPSRGHLYSKAGRGEFPLSP